ncbi:hypothetical protein LTR85_005732 [Meristemomyces frigidus]|nr:hypothetical protein LTR85_005732 [Meristemomyces frigidus]
MSHTEADHLPLFKSPLVHKHESESAYRSPSSSDDEAIVKPDEREGALERRDNDQALHDNPQFQRHAETTNAELFYDLFFVANLTVFTTVHEVNDKQTLAQYIGFFCILLASMAIRVLFLLRPDVRFSEDSVFERIAKASQFGVMIGFAITGPKFDVGVGAEGNDGDGPSLSSFRALSLILMASRLVLVMQYLQSLWFARNHKRTQLPILLIAATYFVAAMIYLGLFFTFHTDGNAENHTYITWYVVAVLETVIATTVFSVFSVRHIITFEGTHLVQRMSLLTLIILGEGVMGLAEKCQVIVKSDLFEFTASIIGNIISGILILYFLYMLYFDWIQEEHLGDVRQQVWAFLHFPLHLVLVLAVEGAAQSLSWRAGVEESNFLVTQQSSWNFTTFDNSGELIVNPFWANRTDADWLHAATTINDTATLIMERALANSESYAQTLKLSDTLTTTWNATGIIADPNSAVGVSVNAAQWIYGTLIVVVLELAGFEGPESASDDTDGLTAVDFDLDATFEAVAKEQSKDESVFALTFVYFFVSVGLVVLLCTLLAALSKKQKTAVHCIRLAASAFVGVTLCLLATIAVTTSASSSSYAWANYATSAWLLPTVVLALFLVVMLNSIRFPAGVHAMPTLVPMRTRAYRA